MNKALTIHLGGQLFTIEEDAYQALQAYISSVKAHFASYPDHDDIINDIETRIAEQLRSRQQGDAVIVQSTIDAIITQMGRVEDFGDDEPTAKTSPAPERRLLRDPDHAIIAGVSAGIAAYFGIDPIIIRLIFLVSLLAGGTGILVYIILWIAMSEAKTPSEKLQMRGDAVTLSSLEQSAREQVAEVKKRVVAQNFGSKLAGFVRGIVQGVGRVITAIIPVFGRVMGVVIAAAATFAFIATSFVAANLIFNAHSPYVDFPLAAVASGPIYFVIVGLGYALAIIPIILIWLLAASLVRLRSVFSFATVMPLVTLWVIGVIVAGVIGVRYGPEYRERIASLPAYQQVERTEQAENFDKLEVADADQVEIIQGDQFSVVASGRQMDLDRLRLKVTNGVLTVSTSSDDHICIFCWGSDRLRLVITMPTVTAITTRDVSHVVAKQLLIDDLRLDSYDASRIELAVDAGTVTAVGHDVSHVILTGGANDLHLELKDAARYEGQDCNVATATLTMHDVSRALVNATEHLTVTATDASRVSYYSSPVVEQHIFESARIMPAAETDPAVEDDYYDRSPDLESM